MTRKINVTAGGTTLMQAKAGIIIFALFLLFGLVFGFAVLSDTPASESGLIIVIGAFFLIWVAVCISGIVSFARILSKNKSPQEKSLLELNFEESGETSSKASGDFENRIRKVEKLKEDGLITEEEYQVKRRQIINEKW